MSAFMQNSDAFAWYMERDPTLRATIVAVAWLDQSPDWDTLLDRIDRATLVLPMFRQRVVESTAPLTSPRWIHDDQFDLAWHVRRIESPPPHTAATVIALARNATMTAFDHAHALWEFTLVEHLEGERAALVMKVHHALTDGIGGMQLALELFDLEPVPPAPPPRREASHGHDPATPARVLPRFARYGERALGLVSGAAGAAVPTLWRAARHPAARARGALETARSIARTLAPVSETRSPIMKGRSIARHLDVLEVELGDLKRAAATADGSLNDAFMAAVTGGLRLYHEHHGAAVDELRVTLPISIRTPDDPPGGNHITLMRFAVPVSDADPASRIRALGRLCRVARDEPSLRYTSAIAGTLNLFPRRFIGSMLKHIDFVSTDIPGFDFPVYLAGAAVERYVAFSPTTGTSVNVALLSYNGTCSIGITIDTAAASDAGVLVDSLRAGFEEVLALGGAHEPVRVPLRGDAHAPKAPASARATVDAHVTTA